jgi:hypothetical protein
LRRHWAKDLRYEISATADGDGVLEDRSRVQSQQIGRKIRPSRKAQEPMRTDLRETLPIGN